ncbi:hypothetical protein ACSZNK_07225 [Aeromonas hydrophila]
MYVIAIISQTGGMEIAQMGLVTTRQQINDLVKRGVLTVRVDLAAASCPASSRSSPPIRPSPRPAPSVPPAAATARGASSRSAGFIRRPASCRASSSATSRRGSPSTSRHWRRSPRRWWTPCSPTVTPCSAWPAFAPRTPT